jgi:hypothetical protein
VTISRADFANSKIAAGDNARHDHTVKQTSRRDRRHRRLVPKSPKAAAGVPPLRLRRHRSKTTILNLAVAELGKPAVLYDAFTGKAALVMTGKGTPAA